jgi:hypothetical protein
MAKASCILVACFSVYSKRGCLVGNALRSLCRRREANAVVRRTFGMGHFIITARIQTRTSLPFMSLLIGGRGRQADCATYCVKLCIIDCHPGDNGVRFFRSRKSSRTDRSRAKRGGEFLFEFAQFAGIDVADRPEIEAVLAPVQHIEPMLG